MQDGVTGFLAFGKTAEIGLKECFHVLGQIDGVRWLFAAGIGVGASGISITIAIVGCVEAFALFGLQVGVGGHGQFDQAVRMLLQPIVGFIQPWWHAS